MHRHLRLVGAMALAVAGASGLTACGPWTEAVVKDDTVVSQKITSVRLDTGSGGLTLRGGKDVTKVSVHREVTYHGDRPEGATQHVDDGVLVLDGCGRNCSVTYTIDLPAGVPVTGKTSTGAVSLSQVGAVHVTTSSGSIELDGVSGTVDVRTSNGEITGRGLTGGRIQAQTTNGAIALTPATPQDVRAQTTNGSIALTMPSGRYQVSAKSGLGQKDIGIPHDPAGPHRLDLTTGNGGITAKSA
ncbi:DUF4097 family beta strand repeat-containing protein [Streptomyces sp. x-80]|uniref:DUF4097 family beta strand repeat-containing protein n=1 Tax=Streptomyces sp. x-80 TaxID=2789282 RepID=UPI00397F39C1